MRNTKKIRLEFRGDLRILGLPGCRVRRLKAFRHIVFTCWIKSLDRKPSVLLSPKYKTKSNLGEDKQTHNIYMGNIYITKKSLTRLLAKAELFASKIGIFSIQNLRKIEAIFDNDVSFQSGDLMN